MIGYRKHHQYCYELAYEGLESEQGRDLWNNYIDTFYPKVHTRHNISKN